MDAGFAEVIRAGFHDEAVDADDGFFGDGLLLFARIDETVGGDIHGLLRFARDDGSLNNLVGNEVFAGAVGADDGLDEGLGHCGVVGQQLLGVFWQAIAAVAKAGVVVVVANARVEAHAFDDLTGIQAVGGGIGV